ncbi:phytoene desaturase family protein [Saliterribacillus persicus]|uniref:Phytoene desaturase n=1 Tax=Saliterribacillus persicus TaxID=930114 RepID=A0A368Y0B5_9BACI|nr:phytoene desaturase family protein [Saliterribacillus persicus]RCW73139.1 phytoene desaturase [Saliterribacillus persicus]
MKIGIVGAGIGGLTSALLLERQGHAVTIYEKNAELGGRIAFETNGEFTIDQGPTIVLLPELLVEILEEAGVERNQLELIPCDPLYDIFYDNGFKMTKWRDPKKQAEEIEKLFPGEGKHFTNYLTDMKQIYEFGYDAFLSKTFHRLRDFLTVKNVKFVAKSKSYRTVSTFMKRYFDHDYLKQAYALQSLYIGGAPHRVPALYGLISYSEHAFGIWYLKGGYASLIPLLERICTERGIQIKKQLEVEEITVSEQTVNGIKTKEGVDSYDSVIFNGEVPFLDQLLKQKRNHFKKKNYKPSSGCLLAYVGVNKRFENREAHQFFLPEDFDQHMKDVFDTKTFSKEPSCYVFNPVALDSKAAPPGKSVLYFLIPTPSNTQLDFEQEKEAIIDKQLTRVEKLGFEGLTENIEWLKIRTPQDALASGLYMGGSFGVAPDLNQSGGFRPQIVHPKIKGLYMVGASVHPGGGIPIVMQGARLLSQHITEWSDQHVKPSLPDSMQEYDERRVI